MGLLDAFLKKKEYPPLSETSPAASHLNELKQPLEKLVTEVSDPLEIIPTEKAAYAFIGKPPKKFGLAWVDADGKIHNFKSLVEEKGLSVISLEKLSGRMREAYIKARAAERYSTSIAGRQVVVTPSESMASDMANIIREYTS